MLSPELQVGVKSLTGRVREENQDRMTRFDSAFGEVFVVADGMGGHLGGTAAASAVVKGMQEHLAPTSSSQPLTGAVAEATQLVNSEIYRQGNAGDPAVAGMGSTMVLAVITPEFDLIVANIGDSRAYLFRDGCLQLQTKDHTRVQQYVDAGMLSEDQARRHPEASFLTRAIGQKPEVEPDFTAPLRLQTGDLVLLCSDGLCGYIEDPVIERTLRQLGANPQDAVDALAELALQAGGEDNVTIQLIQPVILSALPAVMPAGTPVVSPGRRRIALPVVAAIAAVALAGLSLALLMNFRGFRNGRPEPGKALPRETSAKNTTKEQVLPPAVLDAGSAPSVPNPLPPPAVRDVIRVVLLASGDPDVVHGYKETVASVLPQEASFDIAAPQTPREKALVGKTTVVAWNDPQHEPGARKIADALHGTPQKLTSAERSSFSSADILIIIGGTAKR